jgi:catechol 2,3-dioxygenase-like lactoylglutathione lyase family enzyme
MPIGVRRIDHFQITVPREREAECKRFYAEVIGLCEIPKPPESRARGGAWYEHDGVQVHLSIEGVALESNLASKRHVCYVVVDLADAERALREAGVAIIPDDQPVAGWRRFYVRDPGGNRVEIAQPG